MDKSGTPSILLVGAGKFGQHYLRILSELHRQGIVNFQGVAVSNQSSAQKLEVEFPVITQVNETYLKEKNVDAVFVVTPAETHRHIVETTIPHCDVFCEKPLALSVTDAEVLFDAAEKYNHNLMVGHLFQFHPLTLAVKERLGPEFIPKSIRGVFTNPTNTDNGQSPAFEFIHFIYLANDFFGSYPVNCEVEKKGRTVYLKMTYSDTRACELRLGWNGSQKQRYLEISDLQSTFIAEYISSKLIRKTDATELEIPFDKDAEPLQKQIETFISLVNTEIDNPVKKDSVTQAIRIAELSRSN